MLKNARFWVFLHGSYVKLTLRPGQSLYHWWGRPTDEGYEAEYERWTYETLSFQPGYIRRTIERDARDCDGRHGYSSELTCDLDKLDSRKVERRGRFPMYMPDWQKERAEVYDQFARMMNY